MEIFATNINEKSPKNAIQIECILCDYKCSQQSKTKVYHHIITIENNDLSTKKRQKFFKFI